MREKTIMNWFQRAAAVEFPYDPEYEYFQTHAPSGHDNGTIQDEIASGKPRAWKVDREHFARAKKVADQRAQLIFERYRNYIDQSFDEILAEGDGKLSLYKWRKMTWDIPHDVREAEGLSVSTTRPDTIEDLVLMELGVKIMKHINQRCTQLTGWDPARGETNHLLDRTDDRDYPPKDWFDNENHHPIPEDLDTKSGPHERPL